MTIIDEGLENGAAALAKNKTVIEETINKALKSEAGARLKAYLETCTHCGMCSQSCHHFLSNDQDGHFSPAGKVKQTLGLIIKKRGKVTPDQLKKISEIAFTECNLCKRCALYCPFGVDTAFIMLFVRRLCHLLRMVPRSIQETAHSHAATMNQMWVKDDEWADTLQWQEDEASDDIETLRIPMEKEGADVMYSVIAPEPKFGPQLILQASVILTAGGVDFTMPATAGWDNSDMAMYTGDLEVTSRVKRAHFEAASRLKVKRIVMGECGHAFRSIFDVGNRLLGWKMPPIPVTHAVELYWELLKDGKLKIEDKFKKSVTLHDPCNISRGAGLHDMTRNVVNEICDDFIEMYPNREHNFCCGAGGGVINCGSDYKQKRMTASKTKAEQLKNTGAKVLIAPCHNCHSGLKDIIEHYKLDMEIKFLGDILYDVIKKEAPK